MLRQTLVLEHVHERRFPRVIQSLRSRRRQSSFVIHSFISRMHSFDNLEPIRFDSVVRDVAARERARDTHEE